MASSGSPSLPWRPWRLGVLAILSEPLSPIEGRPSWVAQGFPLPIEARRLPRPRRPRRGMTRTLEKLGFIRRERSQTANRQPVLLYITKLGRCVIRHALKVLKPRRRGPTQRAAHTIFVERWWASRRDVLQDLRKTDAHFRRLRHALADIALLVHPWDPDEREDIGLPSRPVFKPERFLPSTPAQIEAARWRPHSRIAGIPPRKPKPPRQPSMSSFL